MYRGFSHCRTQVVAPAREADARKDLSPSYYSYDSDSQAQLCQFQLCKYQLCARRVQCIPFFTALPSNHFKSLLTRPTKADLLRTYKYVSAS